MTEKGIKSLTATVKEVVAANFATLPEKVKLTDSIRGEPFCADSLEVASLVIDLEQAIGIEIPDDDLILKIATVQNIIDYAWAKLQVIV